MSRPATTAAATTGIDEGRRDALRKLLAGATVATAAPVVSTFFAPAGAALTSQAVNRFQLNRAGSGSSALTTGAMTPANTDATGLGCIPAGWATGQDTLATDGVSGSVASFASDRNDDGDVSDPGEAGAHITPADSPDTATFGTTTQVLQRDLLVAFSVTLPAGCRFDTADGFPTAATAQVRAEMLRSNVGPGPGSDTIEGDDPTTFGAPQCVAGTISGISADGRTATISATFVETRVFDDDPGNGNDDWATYKVNDVQLRIAAYCNL
jgi:hypothetical protein